MRPRLLRPLFLVIVTVSVLLGMLAWTTKPSEATTDMASRPTSAIPTRIRCCDLPTTPRFSPLRVDLTTSRITYEAGETVRGVATVSNPTFEHVTVIFTGCQWTFQVLDAHGRVLFPPPPICVGAETNHTFLPGGILVSEFTWDQEDEDGSPVPPGWYVLRFQGWVPYYEPQLMDEAAILILDVPPEVEEPTWNDAGAETLDGEGDVDAAVPESVDVSLSLAIPLLTIAGAQVLSAVSRRRWNR